MLMKLDKIDLFLIQQIVEAALKGKKLTTWDLAKKRDWGEDWESMATKEKKRFLGAKTSYIDYRMELMSKEGIVLIKKENKKNRYILNGDKLFFCKHTFRKGRRNAIEAVDSENKSTAWEI